MQFAPPSSHFTSLRSRYSAQEPDLIQAQPTLFPSVSHPYKTTNKIIVLYILSLVLGKNLMWCNNSIIITVYFIPYSIVVLYNYDGSWASAIQGSASVFFECQSITMALILKTVISKINKLQLI
jgi:hypothetical protein